MTYVIFNFPGSTARVTIKQERIELLGECEEEENFDVCLDEKLGQILKEEVNCSKPKTLEELEDRIRGVMSTIPAEFLRKSVDAIPGRLQQLVERSGAHIEF